MMMMNGKPVPEKRLKSADCMEAKYEIAANIANIDKTDIGI